MVPGGNSPFTWGIPAWSSKPLAQAARPGETAKASLRSYLDSKTACGARGCGWDSDNCGAAGKTSLQLSPGLGNRRGAGAELCRSIASAEPGPREQTLLAAPPRHTAKPAALGNAKHQLSPTANEPQTKPPAQRLPSSCPGQQIHSLNW